MMDDNHIWFYTYQCTGWRGPIIIRETDLKTIKIRSLIPSTFPVRPKAVIFAPECIGCVFTDFEKTLEDVYKQCNRGIIGCVFSYDVDVKLVLNSTFAKVYRCCSLDKIESLLASAGVRDNSARVYMNGQSKDVSTRLYALGKPSGVCLKVFY
ncbi:hypothetical protein IWW56_001322 [Coemansia sp. RSA 2131]|nr:hypothetical protein LPJ76_005198 [Coemansia sp. RSA 638]KAJ2482048.1 hypothetical protein IWW56_001322 [Coemansia sp. RSA 2131]KAJ2545659.1 hypothetical protein GGF49_000168 [Coemansia sp. RSA 1853]